MRLTWKFDTTNHAHHHHHVHGEYFNEPRHYTTTFRMSEIFSGKSSLCDDLKRILSYTLKVKHLFDLNGKLLHG